MHSLIHKLLSVCFALCITASLALRALVFHMPYEYDELFTAVSTDPAVPFAWLYKNYLLVDVHPPLYNTLLWGWNHLVPFGPEIYLRLPSFFMSLAALLIAWFDFPKRFGKTARILFVSLLSCNLYTIAYSQHARSYMLVLLFAVPLTFLFVEMSHQIYTRKRIEPRQWLAFGAVSLLLCWSHYFGALLFGCFSILLAAQAVYYKRKLTNFILVPAVVVALFLPWLIPNFIEQLHFERFAGNWWGNQAQRQFIPLTLLHTVFSTTRTGWIMLALTALATASTWAQFRRKGTWPHGREIILLLAVWVLALSAVALVSLKTFLFFGRYFIAFLPVSYLLITLLLADTFRRSALVKVLVLAFVSLNLVYFATAHRELTDTPKIPTRIISQIFRDFHSDKEMFVVAVEGFPPAAMPAMYGFYINRVYGLGRPVTELVSLDETTRNEVLKRKDTAFIWMPNCTLKKLQKVSDTWHRSFGVYGRISSVCVLKISD